MPDAVVRPPADLTSAGNQDLGQIHQSRVQWMQGEIDRLNQRNKAVEAELEQRQRYLDRIQMEMAKARQEAAEREKQFQMANANPELKAQADELERLLNVALAELDKSNQQNQVVLAELDKTRKELDALRREKDSIEQERDELVAIVDGGESAASIQKLMGENRRLRDRLAQAEAMAKQLGEETRDKDVEIALLKEQIQRIDSEREQLLAENRRYDSHIAGLQQRLRELGQELSPEELSQMASVSPKLIEENELLRTVILKQLRRQNQIKQTKQILLEGLDKLGNEAADLYALVEDMATGPAISPEERKMIREPDVEELVAATAVAQVNATIIVEGEEPDGTGGGILEVKNMEQELLQIQKAAKLDFQEGRYEDAEENYLNFLRYRPRNVVCLCNLALVKITTKQYDDAQSLLEKAIALEDDNGTAYYLLGRTHYEQGRFDEALSRLNEGIRFDPKNAKAHNCVGVISSQKGFANRAEEAFTQAVTIDPKYGDAHFNLAVLFTTGAKPDAKRAMDHYKKAIGLGIPRDATIEDFLENSLFTAAVNVNSY
jgi:tetratricopeptide (TPR) repeat protein